MIELIIKSTEKVTEALIDEMKEKKSGVVVLLTKPFSAIQSLLKKKGVDAKNFVFINTIGSEQTEGIINIPINGLTALSIAISEALQSLPKEHRRIIFDSLNSFLIYHKPEIVKRFILFTFAQMRQVGVDTTIVIGNEKTDGGILPLMQQSADSVVSG
jgi:KaiC/GvpD/RAD55 family RecA-like ATPase